MIKLFHAPYSRSSAIVWLLEELGVPYQLEIVPIRAQGGAPEGYREIQAHKKVPAVVLNGVTITERAAIALHLAESFPETGLAPRFGDPRRAAFLSWLVYSDAVLDPAIAARLSDWSYLPLGISFGTLDDAVRHLDRALSASPYLVGDRFTAADVQIGAMLHYAVSIGEAITPTPAMRAYLDRVRARPAFQKREAIDREHAAT
ncbi:glutathione S-transferase family protein [Sandaracinus amylolyticus]|uniref:glutathione S-transferase family protein n=1 Tax=Sandaracinus amylolyticus TaxID=927083 RepID=UPI001F160157|nr:glutathione S-transferase family protein [Sandaracinus amylolyticus]UJR86200.1 Hypothetical protein I5071_82820 [Sandaracinus amylolyticus]